MLQLDELRIVVVGHIDHGKSTLVGRLLLDSGSVADQKRDQLSSPDEGAHEENSAWLTDQLEAERQGRMTLDSGQAILRTAHRALVLIDTPGHRELINNMLSGAAWADAGLLVVDAARGVEAQTRVHVQLLAILGVRRLVVAINKMDLVNHEESLFTRIAAEVCSLIDAHHLTLHAIVPVSALHGENVVRRAPSLDWSVPPPLLEVLESLPADEPTASRHACLPVQMVERVGDDRYILGRVEGGPLHAGQRLRVWPGGHIHRLTALVRGDKSVRRAEPGQCVTARLDPSTGLARGSVLLDLESALEPVDEVTVYGVSLSGAVPGAGKHLELRVGVASAKAEVLTCRSLQAPRQSGGNGDPVDRRGNDLASFVILAKLSCPLVLDPTGHIQSLHRVLIRDGGRPVGVGTVGPIPGVVPR